MRPAGAFPGGSLPGPTGQEAGPAPRRPSAVNALTEAERAHVLAVLTSDRFVDKSVAQVWATLLDEGTYRDLDLLEAVVDGPEEPENDPEYTRRYVAREAFTRAILNVMAKHTLDALTFPTTRVPAPSNEGRKDWTVLTFPTNTLIASQSLMPSIAVPAGFTDDGVPVGIEIVARPYDEATAFRLASGYETQSRQRRASDLSDQ